MVERFQYGDGAKAVELEAQVPLRICQSCGFEYFDEAAETARHESVCKHLKRLPPRLITAGRDRLARACGCRISRVEFARVSRLGLASLNRWESGELMQTAAYDLLLRLLLIPANYEQVRSGRIYQETGLETEQGSSIGGPLRQDPETQLGGHAEVRQSGMAQPKKWKTQLAGALQEIEFHPRRRHDVRGAYA
jgi:hypothetical protein